MKATEEEAGSGSRSGSVHIIADPGVPKSNGSYRGYGSGPLISAHLMIPEIPCKMDPTLAPVAPCTLAASPDSLAHSAPVLQIFSTSLSKKESLEKNEKVDLYSTNV